MNLKAGKRYFRVDGRATGELVKIGGEDPCFVDPITGYTYWEDGVYRDEDHRAEFNLRRKCPEEQKKRSSIDQRRYRIAKDCLVALITRPDQSLVSAVEMSICLADDLLHELGKPKKGEHHE